MPRKKRITAIQARILARTLVNFIIQKHLAEIGADLKRIQEQVKQKSVGLEEYSSQDIKYFVEMICQQFPTLYNDHNTIVLSGEEKATLDSLNIEKQILFMADLIQDKKQSRDVVKSELIMERARQQKLRNDTLKKRFNNG